jgi:hypothetical protein
MEPHFTALPRQGGKFVKQINSTRLEVVPAWGNFPDYQKRVMRDGFQSHGKRLWT